MNLPSEPVILSVSYTEAYRRLPAYFKLQGGLEKLQLMHELLLAAHIPLGHCNNRISKKDVVLFLRELLWLRAGLSELKNAGLGEGKSSDHA